MPAITRSLPSRPNSAPAYYLARPAGAWITALHRRPQGRPAGSSQTFPSARNPR